MATIPLKLTGSLECMQQHNLPASDIHHNFSLSTNTEGNKKQMVNRVSHFNFSIYVPRYLCTNGRTHTL